MIFNQPHDQKPHKGWCWFVLRKPTRWREDCQSGSHMSSATQWVKQKRKKKRENLWKKNCGLSLWKASAELDKIWLLRKMSAARRETGKHYVIHTLISKEKRYFIVWTREGGGRGGFFVLWSSLPTRNLTGMHRHVKENSIRENPPFSPCRQRSVLTDTQCW